MDLRVRKGTELEVGGRRRTHHLDDLVHILDSGAVVEHWPQPASAVIHLMVHGDVEGDIRILGGQGHTVVVAGGGGVGGNILAEGGGDHRVRVWYGAPKRVIGEAPVVRGPRDLTWEDLLR